MKTLHLQLPISIIRNMGLGITQIVTTETVDIVAVCRFSELAENTKLIVSISTIGTILITARHDIESECEATVITEWFREVQANRIVFQHHSKKPSMSISDYYNDIITKALNSNTSNHIVIDSNSIQTIINNVNWLMKSVTIE